MTISCDRLCFYYFLLTGLPYPGKYHQDMHYNMGKHQEIPYNMRKQHQPEMPYMAAKDMPYMAARHHQDMLAYNAGHHLPYDMPYLPRPEDMLYFPPDMQYYMGAPGGGLYPPAAAGGQGSAVAGAF